MPTASALPAARKNGQRQPDTRSPRRLRRNRDLMSEAKAADDASASAGATPRAAASGGASAKIVLKAGIRISVSPTCTPSVASDSIRFRCRAI